MGTLLRNCAKVHEPIELLFGVVNGVGRGMGVLRYVSQGEKEVSGFFCFCWFEWHIFLTEMYFTRAWKFDSISARTIHCWKCLFIGFSKI